MPFLEYVNTPVNNEEDKQWHVAIGTPYGTHIWQVRDLSEQNGIFKNAMKEQKQYILGKKTDIGLDFKIEKTDIIGMV